MFAFRNRSRLAAAAFLSAASFLLRLPSLAAQEESASWISPQSVTVAPAEFAFTGKSYRYAGTDSLLYAVVFPDGRAFLANLYRFDTLLFQTWGIFAAGSSGSGDWSTTTSTIGRGSVANDSNRLSFTSGIVDASMEGNRFLLSIRTSEFASSLRFTPLLNAWKAGTGRRVLRSDGSVFIDIVMAAPLADVEGSFGPRGAQEPCASGRGIIMKSLAVLPPSRLAPVNHILILSSASGAEETDRLFVFAFRYEPHPELSVEPEEALLVFRNDRWHLATARFSFTTEPSGVGMPYPRSLIVAWDSEESRGRLVSRDLELFNTSDVLSSVPVGLKGLAAAVIQSPVFRRFVARFSCLIRYPDGTERTMELNGLYIHTVVN